MKIAVSGATGFIGRHVLSELARHPVEVVVMTRAATKRGIDPCVKTVQLDINTHMEDTFDLLGRPDALIHLAWGGLPNYRSLHHYETELPNHYRFLSGLVRGGLSALVVTGTCFEYGMQSGQLSEDMLARPDNPYGFAKDTLRRQLEYLCGNKSFKFAWPRLFYLHGEGQAENSLLPQLKRAVESGERVFNMSGGEQLRDYLPVADVAKSIVMLALNKADIGAVNICAGQPISVRQFVEKMIAEHEWDIKPNLGYYPYPDYEPLAFWGNRAKLTAFKKAIDAALVAETAMSSSCANICKS